MSNHIYRERRWHPAKILYVVGSEQEFYFRKLFAVLKKMGVEAELKHIMFGMVMVEVGKDDKGKPILEKMSTRAGRVVLLEDLLSEAIKRSRKLIDERPNSPLNETEKETAARQIGVGAIKYYDLSREAQKSIVFDWEQMLRLNGNSGPYLQYMVARINSLIAKVGVPAEIQPSGFGNSERSLMMRLAQYPAAIQEAGERFATNTLAAYLYELSSEFSAYYDSIPSIKDEKDEAVRSARLSLCQMVGTVLKNGLGLLGIECPERM